MRSRRWPVAACALLAACAAPREEAPAAGETAPPTTAAVGAAPADTSRVRGTLQSGDLGIRMVGVGTDAGLQIDVTTLAESAIELAVDDVRTYYRDLKKRIPDAVPAPEASRLQPFLVGYTGFEKEISFDPTRLEIRSEGATHYSRFIVPVSPGFDRHVVDLYQTVYAIYLFPGEVDLTATLEFRYGDMTSGSSWRGVVDRVQRAKTRLDGGRR